jgi:hypothetical protein
VGSRIKSDTQSHREEGEAATNVSAKSPKSTQSPTAKKKGSREEKHAGPLQHNEKITMPNGDYLSNVHMFFDTKKGNTRKS